MWSEKHDRISSNWLSAHNFFCLYIVLILKKVFVFERPQKLFYHPLSASGQNDDAWIDSKSEKYFKISLNKICFAQKSVAFAVAIPFESTIATHKNIVEFIFQSLHEAQIDQIWFTHRKKVRKKNLPFIKDNRWDAEWNDSLQKIKSVKDSYKMFKSLLENFK